MKTCQVTLVLLSIRAKFENGYEANKKGFDIGDEILDLIKNVDEYSVKTVEMFASKLNKEEPYRFEIRIKRKFKGNTEHEARKKAFQLVNLVKEVVEIKSVRIYVKERRKINVVKFDE
jgi:hypothetical protein